MLIRFTSIASVSITTSWFKSVPSPDNDTNMVFFYISTIVIMSWVHPSYLSIIHDGFFCSHIAGIRRYTMIKYRFCYFHFEDSIRFKLHSFADTWYRLGRALLLHSILLLFLFECYWRCLQYYFFPVHWLLWWFGRVLVLLLILVLNIGLLSFYLLQHYIIHICLHTPYPIRC